MDTVNIPTASAVASATEAISATTTASASQISSSALAALVEENHYILRIEEFGPYGYTPVLFLPILFAGLYALSAMVHIGETAATKHWWLLILVFGCIAEAGGNAIRVYGHFQPREINPYIAQQVILVVTPVFFAAIHYAILGRIIELFGQHFTLAHISPAAIIPLFVVADLISLGVQGTGSGLAAVAEVNAKDTTWGGNIVVIGLCVQLAAYACFQILILTFFWKAATDPSTHENPLWTPKFKLFLVAFFVSSLLVLGRSVFRTVEMINGWIGPISTVEWYYYAFDAAPICGAVVLLNIFHPGFVLPHQHKRAVEEGKTRRKEENNTEGSRKNRPRSSWFVGSANAPFEATAEMNEVTVASSTARHDPSKGWTQPHFRTNSLASSGGHKGQMDISADEHMSSFGWSQPQSPEAIAYGQYRTRTRPNVSNHLGDQAYSPAMMSTEGFDYVPTSPYEDAGFSPQIGSSSSRGHADFYHQDIGKNSASSLLPSTSRQPLSSNNGMRVSPNPVDNATLAAPQVTIWRDSDESSTQATAAAGSSPTPSNTEPEGSAGLFSDPWRRDRTAARTSTASVAQSESGYAYAL